MGSFRPLALGLLVLGLVAFSQGRRTTSRSSSTPTDYQEQSTEAPFQIKQDDQESGDNVKPPTDVDDAADDMRPLLDDNEPDPPLVNMLRRQKRELHFLSSGKNASYGYYRDGRFRGGEGGFFGVGGGRPHVGHHYYGGVGANRFGSGGLNRTGGGGGGPYRGGGGSRYWGSRYGGSGGNGTARGRGSRFGGGGY